MSRAEDAVVPTVPETWEAPLWLTKPKYTKREVMWLTDALQRRVERLQIDNQAMRLRLQQHDTQEGTD